METIGCPIRSTRAGFALRFRILWPVRFKARKAGFAFFNSLHSFSSVCACRAEALTAQPLAVRNFQNNEGPDGLRHFQDSPAHVQSPTTFRPAEPRQTILRRPAAAMTK